MLMEVAAKIYNIQIYIVTVGVAAGEVEQCRRRFRTTTGTVPVTLENLTKSTER